MDNKKTKPTLKVFLLSVALMTLTVNCVNAQDNSIKKTVIDTVKIAEEAHKLISLPEPTFKPFQPQEMDSTQMADLGFDQVYENDTLKFTMRDGKQLFARRYSFKSNTTIVLLHGVLSSSYTMNRTAGLLRDAAGAEVISIDFRGHGQSDGNPGDVDYIDQYSDDVSDVISAVKKNKPGGKIIIAAHSMGGGIALRYAMKKNAPNIDGYLLFAPLLGQNAPTMRKPAATTDTTIEPFIKIHIQRIIGLKMYNSIGIHKYDSLPVLFFNLPKEMGLNKYTYRANESMAPEDYKAGLKAVKKPLLVIVGSKDEAFVASKVERAVTENSNGKVIIIDGATHNGVRHSKKAMEEVKKWFLKLKL